MSRNTNSHYALSPTILLDEVIDVLWRPEGAQFSPMSDMASWRAPSPRAALSRHSDAVPQIADEGGAA